MKKKNVKIELAEQDKIKQLKPYVNQVIKALGHPEALVTDESIVFDFLDVFDIDERIEQIEKARKNIKVNIFSGDFIWKVAERIKNKEKKC